MATGWVARAVFHTVYRSAGIVAPSAFLNSAIQDNQNISKKRSRGLTVFGSDPKRLRLSDLSSPRLSTALHMAIRRRTFRRRPKRRRRSKRRFRRRSTFTKRVRRVIFRSLERKVLNCNGISTVNIAEGDGVSRVVLVHSPLSQMAHGDEEDRFQGNQFWVKGLLIRGQFSMDLTTPSAASAIMRLSLIWTPEQGAGFNLGFVGFGNTTTSSTNPAQVSPNVNPRFFMNAGTPHTGAGYVAPFDTTRVKVIKTFIIPVNPSGDTLGTQLAMPTLFKCYVPIRKMVQVEDPLQSSIAAPPTRYKHGTYFWVLQCLAGNIGTSADTVVNMLYQSLVYFRDP